ncbi:MAG TPA: hypothetical protein VE224_07720 [Pseudolabrys sp.]|nr:hypothetical protein [Pseudolabrys sp.]
MTAQQYLLSQAEHCRRTASDAIDPYIAKELLRLAETFERQANSGRRTVAVPAQSAA